MNCDIRWILSLFSLLPHNPNPNIGLLDHIDIIGPISYCQSPNFFPLQQSNDFDFLVRICPTKNNALKFHNIIGEVEFILLRRERPGEHFIINHQIVVIFPHSLSLNVNRVLSVHNSLMRNELVKEIDFFLLLFAPPKFSLFRLLKRKRVHSDDIIE